jgi:hypothetical protein
MTFFQHLAGKSSSWKLTFTGPDKIRELARRGEGWGDSESRQMLEHAIETGRGGVFLRLTPEQYARLRRA